MKKLLYIVNVIIINLVLLLTVILTFNPLELTLTGINYTNFMSYFSADPVTNFMLIGGLIGLITFNTNIIVNLKK
jgi:hypothetical protein